MTVSVQICTPRDPIGQICTPDLNHVTGNASPVAHTRSRPPRGMVLLQQGTTVCSYCMLLRVRVGRAFVPDSYCVQLMYAATVCCYGCQYNGLFYLEEVHHVRVAFLPAVQRPRRCTAPEHVTLAPINGSSAAINDRTASINETVGSIHGSILS
eukprot:2376783-Rhodomonas_salina.2